MTKRTRREAGKPVVAARYKFLPGAMDLSGIKDIDDAKAVMAQLTDQLAQIRGDLDEAKTKPIVRMLPDGGAAMVLPKPVTCGCGKTTQFVVNRAGETRCMDCDDKFQGTP